MNEITKITGRDNERLKYARRVREGREEGKIFLEGTRLVEEGIRSGTDIEIMFVSAKVRERFATSDCTSGVQAKRVFEISDSLLQSIADTNNSQGVIAIARRPETMLVHIEKRLAESSIPLVLFLQQINNPSNLGAIIRTAEAAGAAGVIVSAGSADPFSSKALRSAMGSSLRLPIFTDVSFDEGLEWAGRNEMETIAADVDATESYIEVDWTRRRMLILGSEAHGLSPAEREQVDSVVVIPFETQVESLNLAVACGVILFEARRQNLN